MKTYSKIKDRSFFRGILTSMPQSTTPSGPACAKARRGTTLIEVMLGLLILVIMVVMLVMSLRHPRAMVVTAAHKQAAVYAASEALEEAVSMGYTYSFYNRTDTVPSGDYDSTYTLHGRSITNGTRTVTEWNADSPPILLITVSVDYPGGDSPVVLRTLL